MNFRSQETWYYLGLTLAMTWLSLRFLGHFFSLSGCYLACIMALDNSSCLCYSSSENCLPVSGHIFHSIFSVNFPLDPSHINPAFKCLKKALGIHILISKPQLISSHSCFEFAGVEHPGNIAAIHLLKDLKIVFHVI